MSILEKQTLLNRTLCLSEIDKYLVIFKNKLPNKNIEFPEFEFSFDLNGASAGRYTYYFKTKKHKISINYKMLVEYNDQTINETIPHEVAHFIDRVLVELYGYKETKPHGDNWKTIMRILGKEPEVYHTMDMTKVSTYYSNYMLDCGHELKSVGKRKLTNMINVTTDYCYYKCPTCNRKITKQELIKLKNNK